MSYGEPLQELGQDDALVQNSAPKSATRQFLEKAAVPAAVGVGAVGVAVLVWASVGYLRGDKSAARELEKQGQVGTLTEALKEDKESAVPAPEQPVPEAHPVQPVVVEPVAVQPPVAVVAAEPTPVAVVQPAAEPTPVAAVQPAVQPPVAVVAAPNPAVPLKSVAPALMSSLYANSRSLAKQLLTQPAGWEDKSRKIAVKINAEIDTLMHMLHEYTPAVQVDIGELVLRSAKLVDEVPK